VLADAYPVSGAGGTAADRYQRVIARAPAFGEHAGMLKQLTTMTLWFLSGWTFGAFLTFAVGAPEVLGPMLGLAAALIVAVLPRAALTWTAQGAAKTGPQPTFEGRH